MAAARDRFVAQGFAGASLDAIARDAGVAKRTLYARYACKADLFAEVVRRMADLCLLPLTEPPSVSDGAPRARLTRIGRHLLERTLAPDALALHRLIIAEASRFPAIATLGMDLGWRRIVSALAAYLEAEVALGRLHFGDGPSVEEAADQFLSLTVAGAQRQALQGRVFTPAERDRRVRLAVDLLLAAHGRTALNSVPKPALARAGRS